MFDIQRDSEAYCWLKHHLEPRYRVVAEPQSGYFSEHQFCYRVYDRECPVEELHGDFRELCAGDLVMKARAVAKRLLGVTKGAAQW